MSYKSNALMQQNILNIVPDKSKKILFDITLFRISRTEVFCKKRCS